MLTAATINDVVVILMISDIPDTRYLITQTLTEDQQNFNKSIFEINEISRSNRLMTINYLGSGGGSGDGSSNGSEEQLSSVVMDALPWGIFLILFIPELLRLVECTYFIIFRQHRRWRLKRIITGCVVEGIDAVLTGFFVFKSARDFSTLQLASFGFQAIFPIAILKQFQQPPDDRKGSVFSQCMNAVALLLHLTGLGVLIWSLVDSDISPLSVGMTIFYALFSL